MYFKIFILVVTGIISTNKGISQGRLKVGGGINYITNDFKQKEHLDNYFAPSVNINYTFLKKAGLAISLENATTFKITNANNNQEQSSGFTSALPVIVDYHVNKTGFYVGAGPAYIKQVQKTYSYDERVSAYFLNALAGVRFKGSPIFGNLIYLEYNLRLSYFKSFTTATGNAAQLSFIIFLKA